MLEETPNANGSLSASMADIEVELAVGANGGNRNNDLLTSSASASSEESPSSVAGSERVRLKEGPLFQSPGSSWRLRYLRELEMLVSGSSSSSAFAAPRAVELTGGPPSDEAALPFSSGSRT